MAPPDDPARRRPGEVRLGFALSLVVALLLAVVALAARGWDPSRLVVAGSDVTDRAAVPRPLVVGDGPGYDGQFFYRLALGPLTSKRADFGIRLDDGAYRQQRILYPAAAWLLSLGRPRLVPWTLLAVNVVGLVCLGLLGVALAESLGRRPLWGLAVPLFPGFTMSLLRDLSEITAVALVLAGLLGLRRRRPLVAAVCLTGAVLARETAVVVAVGGLAWGLWGAVAARRSGAPGRARHTWRTLAPFAAPLVGFAAWQTYLRIRWGSFPIASGKGSATVPFAASLAQAGSGLRQGSSSGVRLALEIVLLLGFLGWVVLRLRRARLMGYEAAACILYAALATTLARDVWAAYWGFVRVLSEAAVLGGLALFSRPGRDVLVLVATWGALWITVLPSLGLRL